MPRTGRRPGEPATRERIAEAARHLFAERGFDRTSVRAVAAEAGVDPALVHHYFGTKDQLFLAAMQIPMDPGKIIPQLAAAGMNGLGERLVRTFIGIWDSPAGAAGVALLRSAVRNEFAARMLREFITTQIMRRVLTHLDLDPAEIPTRASLVASQIIGLAMMRYVIKLEPLASAAPDAVAAAIGPTLQRYISEPIKVF